MTQLPIPNSDIRILVVDDKPDNLRLLAQILESQGYMVLKSLTGKMGLQAAQRNPPDLILLDINMPEMTGYEVCEQLKASEATANIPIIFVSALDRITHKLQAFEMGGQDYITKPFQELEVLARVKNQLLIQYQQRLLVQQNQQLQQEIQCRQQAEAEVRRLNADLEAQVQARTLELQQALNFELALKRISDQVRDSLDQHQILQAAIETLAKALVLCCCDAALYNIGHASSIIRYQWTEQGAATTQGQMLYMEDYPELYGQLQDRLCFAFCQTQPSSIRNHSAILACPIFDDQVNQTGILGDLWLFKETSASFSEMEIHLVKQVANQCAIALRQARLYEAAQAQVRELERLNGLKDDFLSTISHELRTPMANIKMATQMLEITLESLDLLAKPTSPVYRHLKTLREEEEREINLINNLLDLVHLEAGTEPLNLSAVDLKSLLPYLTEPFAAQMQQHQQSLWLDIPDQVPPITTDVSYLEHCLVELLNNACKYTPAQGKIGIAIRVMDNYLRIEVSNSGMEIPEVERDRIFDKFYRIPSNDPWKYGGTGLGLALVKRMVQQLGGTITVASSPDQITTFALQLPRDDRLLGTA